MNREPIRYLQTDPAWAAKPYRVPGEDTTIGDSGCGPTAAASVLSSMICRMYNPVQACQWAMDHGYKAKGQGTYYGFFEAFFRANHIECRRLNGSNAYHTPSHPAHAEARALIRKGWYVIACMGKGLWTRSGHFVVAWWDGNKVEIMDPASTRYDRCHGDPDVFYREVKYYFAVNAEQYNLPTAPRAYPVTWRVCATDGLNVRTGPGTGYAKSGKLAWGDDIQLIGRSSDWYQTPIGWVSADYVVPIPAPKPKPVPEKKPEIIEEDENMTDEKFAEMMDRYMRQQIKELANKDATMPNLLSDAVKRGITDGTRPMSPASRQEAAIMSRKSETNIEDKLPGMVAVELRKILAQIGMLPSDTPEERSNPDGDYPTIDLPEEV